MSGLEAVVADLEGASAALDGVLEDGAVRNEVREMVADVEMMGAER